MVVINATVTLPHVPRKLKKGNFTAKFNLSCAFLVNFVKYLMCTVRYVIWIGWDKNFTQKTFD